MTKRASASSAIADYGRAIEIDPNYVLAYFNRAVALRRGGAAERAIADLDQAIRLDPSLARAYNERGLAWYDSHDLDRAIADYSEAVRRDPAYAAAYNNRGNAFDDKGDTDRAIADYSEALRADPNFALAYYNRGITWRRKGETDRAIADYDQAIRLDPNYATAYNNRGNAFDDKGDRDRALADYSAAIRIDPKLAIAYNNRGNIWRARSEFDKALRRLRTGDRAQPAATRWRMATGPGRAISRSNTRKGWRTPRRRSRSIRASSARGAGVACCTRSSTNATRRLRISARRSRSTRAMPRRSMGSSGCRRKSSAFALLAALVAAGPAAAQLSAAWQTCARSDTAPDDGIAACSTIIDSGTERGRNLAIAHFNRANGWLAKGELDRAVADLSGAIGVDGTDAKAVLQSRQCLDGAAARYERGDRGPHRGDPARRELLSPPTAAAASRTTSRGDFDRAIVDLDAAMRLAPKDARALSARGARLARQAANSRSGARRLRPRGRDRSERRAAAQRARR